MRQLSSRSSLRVTSLIGWIPWRDPPNSPSVSCSLWLGKKNYTKSPGSYTGACPQHLSGAIPRFVYFSRATCPLWVNLWTICYGGDYYPRINKNGVRWVSGCFNKVWACSAQEGKPLMWTHVISFRMQKYLKIWLISFVVSRLPVILKAESDIRIWRID